MLAGAFANRFYLVNLYDVDRIAKMALGIRGFGGLFPLGMMKLFIFPDSLKFRNR